MKLEVNRYYKAKNGLKVYIVDYDPFREFDEWCLIAVTKTAMYRYSKRGTCQTCSAFNIVEEWKDPAKLECTVKLCLRNDNIYAKIGTTSPGTEILGSVRVTLVEGEFAE